MSEARPDPRAAELLMSSDGVSGMNERSEAAEARLAWPVRRDGQDLMLSVQPPRLKGDSGFRPVDVLGDGGEATDEPVIGEGAARLISSLAQATGAGEAVAVQGFAAPRPGNVPMTFTLTASLAEIPRPESRELPKSNADRFELPCGPGVRVQRLARTQPYAGRPRLPMFTATYLSQTDYGVLGLAFATPHVDAAPEFAFLFDSIARTCTLQPAPAA